MSEAKRIVVIGGSAAGPKAAAKARRMDQHANVTIIQKSPDLSMASCGYPYYVGGFFDNRNQLLCTPTGVVRNPKFFLNAKGIEAITDTEVVAIDRTAKRVKARHVETGEESEHPYDQLVLATGATPLMPPVPGTDLEGITTDLFPDESYGIRASADNVQLYVKTISEWMEKPDSAAQLRRNARRRAVQVFSQRTVACKYVALYEALMLRHAKRRGRV